jgi:transcriptional regulator with XRE-family HTH domain
MRREAAKSMKTDSWGSRLRAWRAREGYTQTQFARMLEMKSASPSLVSNWETEKQTPSRRYANRIEEITGITFDPEAEATQNPPLGKRLAELERRLARLEARLRAIERAEPDAVSDQHPEHA